MGDERGPPKEGSERWLREEEYKRARAVQWERQCRGEGGRAHSKARDEYRRRKEGHVHRHGGGECGGALMGRESHTPGEAKRGVGGRIALLARPPLEPAVEQDHQPATLEESLRMLQALREQLEKEKERAAVAMGAFGKAKQDLGKQDTDVAHSCLERLSGREGWVDTLDLKG